MVTLLYLQVPTVFEKETYSDVRIDDDSFTFTILLVLVLSHDLQNYLKSKLLDILCCTNLGTLEVPGSNPGGVKKLSLSLDVKG